MKSGAPEEEVINVIRLGLNGGRTGEAGRPKKTIEKYFRMQCKYREFAWKQQQQHREGWDDGDIVTQNKMLVFAEYWCRQRKTKDGTPLILKKESNKGVMAALMVLFQMQKKLKVFFFFCGTARCSMSATPCIMEIELNYV